MTEHLNKAEKKLLQDIDQEKTGNEDIDQEKINNDIFWCSAQQNDDKKGANI